MDNLTGKTIKGYQIREHIGIGGFGSVYRAYQPAVSREVAIKVILPEYANQPEFIRRFETEARLIARLEHPFIVPLFDYWREPDGAYLVMRYYGHGSLRDALEQRGQLKLETIADMLEQIASALAVAHRKNIVHRDIKPGNILLDEDSNAYLADFGIATGYDESSSKEAGNNQFSGSPAYVSPEVLRDQQPVPASDIYSLTYMIYHLIAGKLPFSDSKISDWLLHHMEEPLPLLDNVSEAVNLVLQRGAAKTPDTRYENVLDMARDFSSAVYDSTGQVRSTKEIAPTYTIEVNPYKGLRSFEENDALDFFGRETLIEQLVERFQEDSLYARFLAVVGPSGSGKSSVVRAGLIPALKHGAIRGSENWFYTDMIPGASPLKQLAAVLLRVAVYPVNDILQRLQNSTDGLLKVVNMILPRQSQLFLLIDQFEEIFTQTGSDAERYHIMDSLRIATTDSSSRLRIAVTIRADFYDRPLLYDRFAMLMRQRTEVVIPMTAPELEKTITGPASRVGLKIEQELVSAIIEDLRNEPGTLPLLQYALTEAFERRNGNLMTLQGYRTSGGALGALARRAEETYLEMSPEEQNITRQVFLRMVSLGEGTEDTRRRVFVSELYALMPDKDTVSRILEFYGRYRLLTFDNDPQTREPTVEIAHEALIRSWERLMIWLDENRNDVRLERMLGIAAEEWEEGDRDKSFLLHGARLAQFEEWQDTTDLALTRLESDYLKASIDNRETRLAAEAERQAREKVLMERARQRLQMIVTILLIAGFISSILLVISLNQSQNAREQRDSAQVARDEARAARDEAILARAASDLSAQLANSLTLATTAQLALRDNDYDLAAVLALEANQIENAPLQTQLALAQIAYNPGTWRRFEENVTASAVDISPDNRYIIAGLRDSTLHLWNIEQNEVVRIFEGHDDRITSVAFSPNGEQIASASWDDTIRIWNTETGTLEYSLEAHTDNVLTLAFSELNNRLVSAGNDNTVRLWNTSTGELLQTLSGHDAQIYAVAINLDGSRVLSGDNNDLIFLWDTTTGEPLQVFEGHRGRITDLAFHPQNPALFVSSSRDDTLRLWNINEEEPLRIFNGHGDRVNTVTFSPQGHYIYSGSRDTTILKWDVETGEIVRRFPQHTDDILGLTVNRSGRIMVSTATDETIRVWHINTDSPMISRELTNTINGVIAHPDASTTILATTAGLYISEGENAFIERTIGSESVTSPAVSPDGRLVAAVVGGRQVSVWRFEDGQLQGRFGEVGGHNSLISSLGFSEDGRFLLTASWDTSAIIWDLDVLLPVRRLTRGHEDRILTAVFSPDGSRILTGSLDGSIVLWDFNTGSEIRRYLGLRTSVQKLAFLPDGQQFVAALGDGTLQLWDVENTRSAVRSYQGHRDQVTDVTVHPDGNTMLSASDDSSLILWNIETGAQIQRFSAQSVTGVVFIGDGSRAVSGTNDRQLYIWRTLPLESLNEWMLENRYLPELSCEQQVFYRLTDAESCPQ